MTKEELISKLSSIRVCVVNMTYTYDIGLMFDVMTKDGVTYYSGYTHAQWPCFKLKVDDEVRALSSEIKRLSLEGRVISDEQLLQYDFCKGLCVVYSMPEPGDSTESSRSLLLARIREELANLRPDQDTIYAYVNYQYSSTEEDFGLFSSYDEIVEYFLGELKETDEYWDEMSKADLEKCYKQAEDEDWECLPFMCLNEE